MGIIAKAQSWLRKWMPTDPHPTPQNEYGVSPYGSAAGILNNIDRLPPFTVDTVDMMLYSPAVSIGLSWIKGPMLRATCVGWTPTQTGANGEEKPKQPGTVTIKCRDPRKQEFIVKQYNRFLKTSLRAAARAIEYGNSVGINRYRQVGSLMEFDCIEERHLRFARPLRTKNWIFAGVELQNEGDEEQGVLNVLGPACWWHTYDAKFGSWFGNSRLRGAQSPWWEAYCDSGAIEARKIWFYKHAAHGFIFWYPLEKMWDNKIGQEVEAVFKAQQMGDLFKLGGNLFFPNTRDEKGNKKWELEYPAVNGDPEQMLVYVEKLREEIWLGMQIPPEIIMASESTGALAGRRVPQQSFYESLDQGFADIVQTFRVRVVEPLLIVNFGEQTEYEVDIESFAPAPPVERAPYNPAGVVQQQPKTGAGTVAQTATPTQFALPAVPDRKASNLSIIDEINETSLDRVGRFLRKLRAEIHPALVAMYGASAQQMIDLVFRVLRRESPEYVDLLADTITASWLAGAGGVVERLPVAGLTTLEQERPSPLPPPGLVLPQMSPQPVFVTTPPAAPPAVMREVPDGLPTLKMTKIDEAVKDLASRRVLTRPDFDRLDVAAKRQAFTVARLDTPETIERIRDQLTELVAEGPSLAEFNKRLDNAVFGGDTLINPLHAETIYRTNVQTAYSQGLDAIMANPIVANALPFEKASTIADDRRTDFCAWLSTAGCDGTAIFWADDTVYRRFRPPCFYNCRTSRIPMTKEDAAEAGVKDAQEWIRTGIKPQSPYRMPQPPAELARETFAGQGALQFAWTSDGIHFSAGEQLRAPAGGINIAGKEFAGGEFIPSETMDKATKEDRARIESVTTQSPKKQNIFKPSNAEVSYGTSSKKGQDNIDESIRHFIGNDDAETIASIVGSPDDGQVEIDTRYGGGASDSQQVIINIETDSFNAKRYLGKDSNGKVFIENSDFRVKSQDQGKGIGAEVFGRQVEYSQEHGVSYIKCHAARWDDDGESSFNGYYTWPRMGYDQSLESIARQDDHSRQVSDKALQNFPDAKTVLDIMESPGGREWWKENGTQMEHAVFDLSQGSRSLAVHQKYLEERAKRKPNG